MDIVTLIIFAGLIMTGFSIGFPIGRMFGRRAAVAWFMEKK